MTSPSLTPTTSVPAAAFVDALNGVFGKHPKAQATHAKGMTLTGTFTPSGAAKDICSAPLFGGGKASATVRFSVGGGDPAAGDASRSVRGMALSFAPEGDAKPVLDLVCITAPMFFASTPQNVLAFFQARAKDPATGKPDPERVKAYNDSHPDCQAQLAYLAATNPPASFAQAAYHSTHAFEFTNSAGQLRHARWLIEPQAGRVALSDAQMTTMPADFLAAELQTRLQASAVTFDVCLQLAVEGDAAYPLNDPSVAWPEDAARVVMGQVQLNAVDAAPAPRVFDPTRVPSGMGLGGDPVLLARPGAYSESFQRRTA